MVKILLLQKLVPGNELPYKEYHHRVHQSKSAYVHFGWHDFSTEESGHYQSG
jgi:hypothetical protein